MKNLLTVVFIGFDGYSDLWNDCIGLFQRFWPDCPYEVAFVNNTKEVSWPKVKVLHAGKEAEWSKKVQLALKNCHTPYICLLLEDYLVGDFIHNAQIEQALQRVIQHQLYYYQMGSIFGAYKRKNPLFRNIPHLHTILQNQEYGISLQPAIWEVNYLKKLLGTANYNAWKFECNCVQETHNKPNVFIPFAVMDERNLLKIQHAVIKSQYLPETIKYFKKRGIILHVKLPVMGSWTRFKRGCVVWGKKFSPTSQRQKIKYILEKCGMKFASTISNK